MNRSAATLLHAFSLPGLVLASIFFAASLTPSLIPRTYLVQGSLSGMCAAIGYMLGGGLAWLWAYLELPQPVRIRYWLVRGLLPGCVILCLSALWLSVDWQNATLLLWNLPAQESAAPYRLLCVAAGVFLVLLVLGRLFRFASIVFAGKLTLFVPRRVSLVVGVGLAALLFWSAGQGVLLRHALAFADASFQEVDALIEDELPPPSAPAKTGSPASSIDWQGLGRRGRHFISSGPSGSDISAFWNAPAREPVRVYVGLNNAASVEERAALALRELQRQKAFERSVLVVVAPTGTGWVDPAALDTLEYLHHGDVASVALQYSYLASWLSLLVEPEEGAAAASALFDAIYRYWTTLPRDHRPRLYLHGLSLGALNSQLSADAYSVIADPFQGALWSGPPFRSERWKTFTRQRNAGSPEWLAQFRDGSLVRFANQQGLAETQAAPWGPVRFIYLQYASDPIVFFDVSSALHEPAWMQSPRGPDVAPDLRWVPLVTMLQLSFDMMIGTTSPVGYGHVYAPQHYIDCWIALTDPSIDMATTERLKTLFATRPLDEE